MNEQYFTVQDVAKRSVEAKTLVDAFGNPVLGSQGKPYTVPKDYDPLQIIAEGLGSGLVN